MLLVFDQTVDAGTVLASTSIMAGEQVLDFRIATAEEIAADAVAARLAAGVPEGRAIAARPLAPFPFDTTCSATLQPGVRSLEGPRATTSAVTWDFATPGRFRVHGLQKDWRGRNPVPGATWVIELSNPVDPASFEEAMVSVEPPVERLVASVSGSYVHVAAASLAGQCYHVTLDPALRDVFGQTLGPSDPVRVDVGQPATRLSILGGNHVILDPKGLPVLAVRTIGINRIRVRVHTVGPDDWTAWQETERRR